MLACCAYCETQRCAAVAKRLEKAFNCKVIQPKSVEHRREKGKPVDILHDMMPGYLLLYFAPDQSLPSVEQFRTIDGFRYLLKYSDGTLALRGDDNAFAQLMLDKGGVIGRTKVYKVGQRIHICKGAFEGVDADIVSVDRRYSRMVVKIPFSHMEVKACVEYEMVDEIKE